MSEFRRFISYIYSYHKAEKLQNTGFAKIEARGDVCRMEIHIKGAYPGKVLQCNAYGFYRKNGLIKGVLLGKFVVKNGIGDVRIVTDRNRMGNTIKSLEELGGIYITINEEEDNAMASEWDNIPVDTGLFRVHSIEDEAVEEVAEESGFPREENMGDDTQWENLETAGEAGMAGGTVGKAETVGKAGTVEKAGTVGKAGTAGEARTAEKAGTMGKAGTTGTVEKVRAVEKIETVETNKTVETIEVKKEKLTEESSVAGVGAEGRRQQAEGKRMQTEERRLQAERRMEPTEVVEEQVEVTGSAQTEVTAKQTEEIKSEEIAANTSEQSTTPETHAIPPTQSETILNEQSVLCGEMNINVDNFQKSDSQCGEKTEWKTLLREYPIVNPFTYMDNIEVIKIQPKDMNRLAKKYWVLGNNSFLLHGYCSYRYLILGRNIKEDTFFIGIPGIFHPREKMMASMFGFNEFRMSRNGRLRQGEFGYYIRQVELE